MASYDPTLKAPKCEHVHHSGSCTTQGTGLLNGKANSVEKYPPNTIDDCEDGASGKYKQTESIEAITITASDAGTGGVLTAGAKARVTARVYTFEDGADDVADFYYTSDLKSPVDWKLIGSKAAGAAGIVTITSNEFVLPRAEVQAVRVNYRWTGGAPLASPCSGGEYDDVDDLIYVVDTTGSIVPLETEFKPGPITTPQALAAAPVNCDELDEDRCTAALSCEWEVDSLFDLGECVVST